MRKFQFKFHWNLFLGVWLTHWGRVTHICIGKLTIIGSDNGLSPGRRQAIIWTNAAILLIGPLGTNFSEILNETSPYRIISWVPVVIAFIWMPQNLTNEKSTLIQVMAWCRQAASQYLSQLWHRSLSPGHNKLICFREYFALQLMVVILNAERYQHFSRNLCIHLVLNPSDAKTRTFWEN